MHPSRSSGGPLSPRLYWQHSRVLLLGTTVLGLVLLRAWPHVFSAEAHFDSDQAIMGIMADDLAHRRALPLFCYGQKYLLALEAWLAAPLFIAFGTSVATLKSPLLIMNLVAAWLLLGHLVRTGLSPAAALVAALPFLVPSVNVAKTLVAAHGANIEPFVAATLLWALRGRPILYGSIAGLLYLNREFVLYALVALLIVEGLNPGVRNWRWVAQRSSSLAIALGTVVVGRWLGPLGNNYFGFDSFSLSLDDHPVASAKWLLTVPLPAILGVAPGPSPLTVPVSLWVFTTMQVLLVALGAGMVARTLVLVATPQTRRLFTWDAVSFPIYLLLTALFACAPMVLLQGQPKDVWASRYILLALLGPVGAFAFYLRAEPWRPARLAVVTLVVLLGGVNAIQHAAVLMQSLRGLPKSENRLLAEELVERGIEVGSAPYWQAYAITFLAGERVRLTASRTMRVRRYEDEYRARQSVAFDLQQQECLGGVRLGTWYACPRTPSR